MNLAITSGSNHKPLLALALILTGLLSLGRLLPASTSPVDRSVGVNATDLPNSDMFSFAASGDLGGTSQTSQSFRVLQRLGTDFFLALGDLSYQDTGVEPQDGISPSPWCNYVASFMGKTYPFEIVTGNHEALTGHDGYILNFATCLPDRLGAVGTYPVNYYFDYPPGNPIARIFMVTPNMNVAGIRYSFASGSSEAYWLSNGLRDAQAKGLWTIIGMHYPCLNVGVFQCETNGMGSNLMNLLLSKHVDLVLSAHEHNYQRTKQLTCATDGNYRPECVANDGSSRNYPRGAGTVFTVQGDMGGGGFMHVNPASPDAGYMANMMGGSQVVEGIDNGATPTPGGGRGFMLYTVGRYTIKAHFVLTQQQTPGQPFGDDWSIGSCTGDCVNVSFSVNPQQPTVGQTTVLQANAQLGNPPYTYTWTFDDTAGTTANGQTITTIFSAPGRYQVTVAVIDHNGATGSFSKTVTVAPGTGSEFTGNYTISQMPESSAIQFRGSAQGGMPPYNYNWEFGDGQTANGRLVQHTYGKSGNYSITLTITDKTGKTATVEGKLRLNILKGSSPALGLFNLVPAMIVAVAVASGVVVLGRSRFGRRIIPRTSIRWYEDEQF